MKTTRHLFERLCDPDHLDRAADATVRGKRRRRDIAWFLFRREGELNLLARELSGGTYCPQPPQLVRIRDPKPRLIARAGVAERIVDTALVALMAPIFCRSLMPEAYACLKGKGTHRAVLQLTAHMRRHAHALHLDIKSYFPSIDLEVLRRLIARRIRDDRFLEIVERVVDAGRGLYDDPEHRRLAQLSSNWPPRGRGLPIGSSLSQLSAAHVYLSGADHFAKRELKVPGYLRYVDDLFLFGRTRAELRSWRKRLSEWLAEKRGLRLKHENAPVLSCRGHLDALGHRIERSGASTRERAYARLARRTARQARSAKRRPDFERSMAATTGVVLG